MLTFAHWVIFLCLLSVVVVLFCLYLGGGGLRGFVWFFCVFFPCFCVTNLLFFRLGGCLFICCFCCWFLLFSLGVVLFLFLGVFVSLFCFLLLIFLCFVFFVCVCVFFQRLFANLFKRW